MSRASRLVVTVIIVGIIILLLLPAIFYDISFLNNSLIVWAGLLSMSTGIFSFVQRFILIKKQRGIYLLYQGLMIALGVFLIHNDLNTFIHQINKFANSIITIIYILIFLVLIVLYRKQINPRYIDINEMSNKKGKSSSKKKQKKKEYNADGFNKY